ISAMVLEKLKRDAEAFLGEPVTQAVITVPAYFNDTQRTATKQAGEIAGLEVLRIINEPTAAALAYGHQEQQKEATVLVYDLGGGTFDVSILDVEVDKSSEDRDFYEVKATTGDTKLGGDDFDERLVDHIADEFQKEQGIDLRKDRQALQRLKEAAEKAKCELSTTVQTQVSLPFITSVEGEGPKHLEMAITRAKFEELVKDLVDKTTVAIEQALKDASMTKDDIDEVLLVGGSTRMPAVQELVQNLLGKEPAGGINPDEVVAVGAAIQADVLGGGSTDMVLVDVTPLTLGVETRGDMFDPLIERNTAIPTKVSRVYTTASNFQPTVEVHVLQGERAQASQNKSLGRFHLDGLPPAPAGIPQIEVTFDIDANGILNVAAKDQGTGKEQNITITGSGHLDDDDVSRMVDEAESHRDDDETFRELANARNDADRMATQLETALKDLADKVEESDKTTIESKVEALREAAKGDDAEAMKAAIEDAQTAMGELSTRVYQAAQQATDAEGPQAEAAGADADAPAEEGGGDDDDVIDAEFTADDE
ncbi:MAG TPA: molecular chaperone DnaK, partial [Armatimonadota bacterium]|nr:molecular chaperone DnaK [Armatimonadota bacterium]